MLIRKPHERGGEVMRRQVRQYLPFNDAPVRSKAIPAWPCKKLEEGVGIVNTLPTRPQGQAAQFFLIIGGIQCRSKRPQPHLRILVAQGGYESGPGDSQLIRQFRIKRQVSSYRCEGVAAREMGDGEGKPASQRKRSGIECDTSKLVG